MNPRLVKFTVQLQNGEKEEKTTKSIHFKQNGGNKNLFEILKLAKVTVPIDKNH